MDIASILVISMFATLMLLLMGGFPVALTLAGVGLIFGGLGLAADAIDFRLLKLLPLRVYDNVMQNELLLAIPLFIAMGVVLEKSGIAEELLDMMSRLMGRIRGGLALSVTVVGALLAASTGIVGATVVTMGLLSLPTMMRKGYAPGFATGSIAAAGTLGQIIPPSIVLILLTDVMSNSWADAQRSMGIFSPQPITTGDVFAAALLPGLGLVGLYLLYQLGRAYLTPNTVPALDDSTGDEYPISFYTVMKTLLPPLGLILAVLGSIIAGIATPTKAAAIGAIGAMALAAIKKGPDWGAQAAWAFIISAATLIIFALIFDTRSADGLILNVAYLIAALMLTALAAMIVALFKMATPILQPAMDNTVRVSTMIYTILIGAALFSLVFRALGGDELVRDFLNALGGGFWGAFLFVMILMFILGFFLDFIEITFVVVPVVAPVLLAMDGSLGPLWLAIMMAINLQTSFLTPPFGFALFYLRGVMPDNIKTSDLYKGAIPFVLIQLFALALFALFPEFVTWLPTLNK